MYIGRKLGRATCYTCYTCYCSGQSGGPAGQPGIQPAGWPGTAGWPAGRRPSWVAGCALGLAGSGLARVLTGGGGHIPALLSAV